MSATSVLWCVGFLVWFLGGLWLYGDFQIYAPPLRYVLDLSPLCTSVAPVILRMIRVTGPTALACKHVKARQKKRLVKMCFKLDTYVLCFNIPPCFMPGLPPSADTYLSNGNEWYKWDKLLTCAILVTFESVTGELLHTMAAQVHVGWGAQVALLVAARWSSRRHSVSLKGPRTPLRVCCLWERPWGEKACCCPSVGKAVKSQSSWSILCL